MFTFPICYRPSVVYLSVCLSVTLVHPIQPVEIFGNIFTLLILVLAHPLTSTETFTEIVPEEPFRRRIKHNRVAKYIDLGPIEGDIAETVQDRW